ncbi:hypothetical protein BDR26DRAFT_872765 [Obelidium mucronatum]|nr:hypothetical protein BDR26DRAFT_872765 [Obelidium mucronatum]
MGGSWNTALEFGYGSCLVGSMIGCTLYWCLAIVLADLMVAFPLAFGKFMGSIISQFQIWEIALIGASGLTLFGQTVSEVAGVGENLEPLWWVCIIFLFLASTWYEYLLLIAFNHLPVKWMYGAMVFIVAVQTLAYIIGPLVLLPSANAAFWAGEMWWMESNNLTSWNETLEAPPWIQDAFPMGFEGVLQASMPGVWSFLGIEVLPTISLDVNNFKSVGPRAVYLVMGTSTIIYFLQIIICPIVKPGAFALISANAALFTSILSATNFGDMAAFQTVLGILYPLWTNFICCFASFYNVSKHITCLGHMGYAPMLVTQSTFNIKPVKMTIRGVPWFSLLTGLGWECLTVLLLYELPDTDIATYLSNAGE